VPASNRLWRHRDLRSANYYYEHRHYTATSAIYIYHNRRRRRQTTHNLLTWPTHVSSIIISTTLFSKNLSRQRTIGVWEYTIYWITTRVCRRRIQNIGDPWADLVWMIILERRTDIRRFKSYLTIHLYIPEFEEVETAPPLMGILWEQILFWSVGGRRMEC